MLVIKSKSQIDRDSSGLAAHNPLAAVAHGHSLAEAIVDTVREPLVVLDRDLRVIAASRSFYRTFAAEPRNTQGRKLYELGAGQWNIPALRSVGDSGCSVRSGDYRIGKDDRRRGWGGCRFPLQPISFDTASKPPSQNQPTGLSS